MRLDGGRVGSFGSRWGLFFFISVRFFLLVIPKSRERLCANRIIGMPHLISALWVSWFGPHLVPDLGMHGRRFCFRDQALRRSEPRPPFRPLVRIDCLRASVTERLLGCIVGASERAVRIIIQ